MARNEAVILPVNCVSAHKTYYARYDYAYDEVVKLDTKYISEWSFMLDIKILFKTVLIVLGQKGSM